MRDEVRATLGIRFAEPVDGVRRFPAPVPVAVVVAIQYRLGAWGFLDLSAEVDDAVANGGLLDALAAIDWVRRSIAGFGGDPERIVINGASAGAGIVGALVAA